MKLLLPVAGNSSRFPNMRPKWLLTMPSGRLMIEESISLLSLTNIDEIIVIARQSHLEKYVSGETIRHLLNTQTGIDVQVVGLSHTTSSQSDTVACGIRKCFTGDASFFVKDVDNSFSYTPTPINAAAYIDLNSVTLVNASAKSYIGFDSLQTIYQIVEKKVVSSFFCCGGYSFASSNAFLSAWESLQNIDGEVYLSHVIYDLIQKGISFNAAEAYDYSDWGTLDEYNCYKELTVTIFSDFDGVLVENSSKFSDPPWSYNPITNNLTALRNRLLRSPLSQLVITTSRPVSQKAEILKFLSSYDIPVSHIINDLPHCKRVLINDFSSTNGYPTAQAISIPRNSQSLDSYLN